MSRQDQHAVHFCKLKMVVLLFPTFTVAQSIMLLVSLDFQKMIPLSPQKFSTGKGTSYKKGDFLVLNNDESMEFGELVIILIQDNASVYFVMDMHKSDHLPKYHLYSVTKQSTGMQCVNINDLVDFYPLTSYIIEGHSHSTETQRFVKVILAMFE